MICSFSVLMLQAQDTLVCDNGGFEEGFKYYKGFTGLMTDGSDTCAPVFNAVPTVFSPATLPTNRRFAIVGTGSDPLVGIDQVMFGDSALMINNRFGHTNQCSGDRGVDRITKRFKVDANNRDFTVWYAVALENPLGHVNSQPFFNISCDLAPQDELCFDAEFLDCEENYSEPPCSHNGIDVLDWSCHRMRIPESEIGNIATIEITASDCGCGAHMGYAYIDGFCEDCTGSTLGTGSLYDQIFDGSVGHYSCDGSQLTVCGDFQRPKLCGAWELDTFFVPNYTVSNKVVNASDSTFCFDIHIDELGKNDCIELYTELQFTKFGNTVPLQTSNSIEICRNDFTVGDISVFVGSCSDNDTPDDMSDDYYFIDVQISGADGAPWDILRSLIDPYPNETGQHIVGSGTGNGTFTFGPFYIQDGDWYADLLLNSCNSAELVEAPNYCSGCIDFQQTVIDNITCDDNSTADPSDDTWGFDLFVPGSSSNFFRSISVGISTTSYGSSATSSSFSVDEGCVEFTVEKINSTPPCEATFVVCPPTACSSESICNLEAYVEDIQCIDNTDNHYVTIDIGGYGPYYCYEIRGNNNGIFTSDNANYLDGSLTTGLNQIGPLSDDVYIQIYNCSTSNCSASSCTPDDCVKILHVPKPDCDDRQFNTTPRSAASGDLNSVVVYPNPVKGMLNIESTRPLKSYMIYDVTGAPVASGKLQGTASTIDLRLKAGVYIFQYIDVDGEADQKRIISIQ